MHPALAEGVFRIATYAAPLSRDGPGLVLRDILDGEGVEIKSIIQVIAHIDPDILILTDIDFDAGGHAVKALSESLEYPFPYWFSLPPNSGVQTGLDLNGNGRTGDPQDALGFGRFRGDGGMAVLSRFPIRDSDVRDFSDFRWNDLPQAQLPMAGGQLFPDAAVFDSFPLSSTGHWIVPIHIADHTIHLLVFRATPPVFDGPEDFNGLRNADELRLWSHVLDGAFGPPPTLPVVVGNANLDPADGEGRRQIMAEFLARADLQDPQPRSQGGVMAADADHVGDPALDTVDWPDGRPGNLRVSYVLPSADLTVRGSGVFWPAPDLPEAELLDADGNAAGVHRLVWVDVEIQTHNQ